MPRQVIRLPVRWNRLSRVHPAKAHLSIEWGWWHADFNQGGAFEEGFLLDPSQLVPKLQVLQVVTVGKCTVHNFCDLCLREIHLQQSEN